MRLYETQRTGCKLTLTAEFDISEAWRGNFMKDNEARLELTGRSVTLDVHPFQIVTPRLVPLRH